MADDDLGTLLGRLKLNDPEFVPVDRIYQEGDPPRWASRENQILSGTGWQSREVSLFGIRLYKGLLPTISPHGEFRVSVPFSRVIRSPDDFLLPLRRAGPNGVGERLVESSRGNHYFWFVYIRAADIKALKVKTESVRQWRIGAHPHIRLVGDTLSYEKFVAGFQVWYDILVPYKIEFETEPVDDETVWDDVKLTNRWGMPFEVTDPTTAAIVRALPIFGVQEQF